MTALPWIDPVVRAVAHLVAAVVYAGGAGWLFTQARGRSFAPLYAVSVGLVCWGVGALLDVLGVVDNFAPLVLAALIGVAHSLLGSVVDAVGTVAIVGGLGWALLTVAPEGPKEPADG